MRGKLGLLLFLSAVLIVGGCGGTSSDQSSSLTFEMAVLQDNGAYTIYGIVYNDVDGDGIMNDAAGGVAGAMVTLIGTGLFETTGSDGLFDFHVSEAGAYTVHMTEPLGYFPTNGNEIGVLVEGEYGPVEFGLQLVDEVPIVDVKPGSDVNPLNLKSNGVLPVAICGSADFDVRLIDPTSLDLNGVEPLRWSYEDVCGSDDMAMDPDMPEMNGDDEEMPDGYEDMTLKFSTQEIVAWIIAEFGDVARNDIVTLTMTGKLMDVDGTIISGEETVRIVQVP